jgi:hypothetical protein
MCPPDHYFAPYKKAGKKGMTSTSNNSPNYKTYNRSRNSGSDWSRNSGMNKSSSRKNYESDKYAGHGKTGSGNYSIIEQNPYSSKRTKSKNYSHLLGAKKIKNKSRSGHQEGLFASNVNRYQERKTYHVRKRGRLADRVGVKKLH